MRRTPAMPFRPAVILSLLLVLAAAVPRAEQAAGPPAISGVSVQAVNGAIRVTLSGTGPLVPSRPLEVNAPPPRLVLDFPGVGHAAPPVTSAEVGDLLRVRTARYSAEPLVTRVVFDLSRRVRYRVDTSAQGQGRIVVVLGVERANTTAASAPAPPSAPPASPVPALSRTAPVPEDEGDAALPPPAPAPRPAAVPPPSAPAVVTPTLPPSSAAAVPNARPAPAPPVPAPVRAPAASSADYVVGPQDVLAISLWDWPDYSGKYTVESDGTFAFPVVGRVPAAGARLRDLEADLTRRLAAGYFRDPQLSVSVEQYRSQRIFIVGEVRTPGNYPLTAGMTLLEALAHAGSLTAEASPNAIVVRNGNGRAAPPAGQPDAAEVLQVDLKKLETGSLAENIALQDGDTIFVSRAERTRVFVFGQVRNPGAYPIEPGMTVLQALALAGGVTDRGSTRGIKIVRWVDGRKREIKVKLDELVQSGDTIVVSERFF